MTVESLTLEQKVGQLFHVGFSETEATEAVESLIRNYHVGGVIYFSRNLETPAQTRALSRSLQETAAASDTGLPLFLSADQEGGTVRRLPFYAEPPGAMAVGATDDPAAAAAVATITARQLRSVGINLNLAPVLDVNNNPENPVIGVRSYGEEPERVAEFGRHYLEALQSAGVVACGKHFPGHGDTATDSHVDLPVVDASADRLERVEFAPFEAAIGAGIDAIMTAHVAFPSITDSETTPATLSRRVLTDTLRDRLGFEGMIVTDCMEMDAIADTVGTARGAVEAIDAGADVVLVSHSHDRQRRAIEAVIDAVETGEIPESRIDDAVERNLALKRRRELVPDEDAVSRPDSARETFQSISRRAVTWLVDQNGSVPFSTDEPLYLVAGRSTRGSRAEDERPYLDTLRTQLTERGFTVREVAGDGGVDPESIPVGASVLCCTTDVRRNPGQIDAVERLLEGGFEPVVVALRNPYDVDRLPPVDTLTTYDPTVPNLVALSEVLAGDRPADGRAPSSLD